MQTLHLHQAGPGIPRSAIERDPKTGEELVSVPDVCGPFWWAQIHGWAENIRDHSCAGCGGFAVVMANAMHDLVNHHLGKPFQRPDDFRTIARAFAEASVDLPATAEQVPDRYGSRCREPTGQWTFSDRCPASVEGNGTPYTFALGPTGMTRYDLRFRVLDAGDLVASNDPFTFEPNPAFPPDLQPRMRTRAANQEQVLSMAANLAPDALLVDFRSIDRGAPIVGEDLVVESGNGRVMALVRAAAEYSESYGRYREALTEIAPSYGLDVEEIEALEVPVLVRERLTDVDRRQFVLEANGRATLSTSAVETARADAARLSLELLMDLQVGEQESITDALRAARNRPLVARFLGLLPAQERAQIVAAGGEVSQEGVLAALAERGRSARRIGLVLRTYADSVIDLPPSEQAGLFGEVVPPSKEKLWERALLAEPEAVAPLFQGVDSAQDVTLEGEMHTAGMEGRFSVDVIVSKPGPEGPRKRLSLIVDTGATVSVLPAELIEELDLPFVEMGSATIAGGREVRVRYFRAEIAVDGRTVISRVAEMNSYLLGVNVLEELGLRVNPSARRLERIPLEFGEAEQGSTRLSQPAFVDRVMESLASGVGFGLGGVAAAAIASALRPQPVPDPAGLVLVGDLGEDQADDEDLDPERVEVLAEIQEALEHVEEDALA